MHFLPVALAFVLSIFVFKHTLMNTFIYIQILAFIRVIKLYSTDSVIICMNPKYTVKL